MLKALRAMEKRLHQEEQARLQKINCGRQMEHLPPYDSWEDYQILAQIRGYKEKKKKASEE